MPRARPIEDPSPLRDEEKDQDIPTKLKVGAFDVEVEQISPYKETPNLFGDFDSQKMKIRIVTKPNKQQNKSTLLHELFHAIDFGFYPAYAMQEQEIHIMSQAVLQAMQKNDFCFHPEAFKEGENKDDEKKCITKTNGKIKLKDCKIDIYGTEVDTRITDIYNNSEDFNFYNPYSKKITITELPSEDTMKASFVHSFIRAVDDIERLKIDKKKLNFLGANVYQVLKENNLCFREKKEEKK